MVKQTTPILALCLAGLALDSRADEFDYEIGLDYDASRFSNTTSGLGPGAPPIPLSFDIDQDADSIDLRGRWFFDGVVINEGPRERAVFLAQASSISLSYARLDGESVFRTTSNDPAFPSSVQRSEQSGDAFAIDGRYVWSTSGWYVVGALATADVETRGDGERFSADVTSYAAGVGKYFGNRTAVDLVVMRAESDGSDANDVSLTVTHLGDLGSTWQYAADVALKTDDIGGSDGSYDVRASLYPSRDFGFGAGIQGALGDSQFDSNAYEVFASWFPAENVGIEANYGWVDADPPPNRDTDSETFGVRGVYRF